MECFFYDDHFPQSHILHDTATYPQPSLPLLGEENINEIIETKTQDEPLNVIRFSPW